MNLQRAIEIAVEAHKGQLDKAGQPYILHPLTVMFAVIHLGEKYAIVAVLHDVVEDTDWSLDRLREEGFDEDTLLALESVTRKEQVWDELTECFRKETYREFIRRAKTNLVGRIIKIEDLKHNLEPTRL